MQPLVIAVAPNGARKTKLDHPRLPISPDELVQTARDCHEAGAAMMHFHVRDRSGRHSLDPEIYRPALKQLESEIGDKMLLQVSSEAAGRYHSEEQIEYMKRLAPHCLSCGLREIFSEPDNYEDGARFLQEMHRAGTLIQYILYSPAEVRWYENLCTEGVIPGQSHFLLFVLGRYDKLEEEPIALRLYLAELKSPCPWMVCAFGQRESEAAAEAIRLGGHVRVGFENNLLLPGGSIAPDNSSLVELAANAGRKAGRIPGDRKLAITLHGHPEREK